MRFGFCGPTYQARTPNADAERCIDLLPEIVDSPSGKSKLMLVDRPGSQIFANLGSTASLGGWACQPNGSTTDRDFEVVQNGPNQQLIEVFQDGSKTVRGELTAPTSTNVTFADNGLQLAICTGGKIWVFTYASNVLSGPVAGLNGAVSMIECIDTIGIALLENSSQFQTSAVQDFTSWPGLNVAQVSEFPDNVISMIVNQRGLWFHGRKATVPYYNAGAYPVAFLPVQGVFIEDGICGQFARAKLDNSIFWWDANERGRGIARRANGYIPQRISTHAIEIIVGTYKDISDAISWAEEREGHALFITYFPSGWGIDQAPNDGNPRGATWVYDVSTGMWSEWSYWNAKAGHREAYHARNHRFAWGKHLNGDWSSGNLYQSEFPQQSGSEWSFRTDAGNSIRSIRRGPPVSIENGWIYHEQLVLAVETGIAPQPPLSGPSNAPYSYILGDANGKSWAVTVTDNGILEANSSVLPAIAPALTATDEQQTYRLSVALDSTGAFDGILATPVGFDPQADKNLLMATIPSFKECRIFITKGQAQTSLPYSTSRGPQITFRWSNDNGHTWSQPHMRSLGKAGEYTTRVYFNRLGRARTRTYELSYSDPVPLRVVDAYLIANPGFQRVPRTIKQFQENA